MPKFTTPCFVRVEDAQKRKELIEWLRHVGYRATISGSGGATFVIDASTGMVYVGNYSDSEQRAGRIDCSTNIDLFKALAGMRSDTDKGQRFTDGKHWYIMNENKKGDDEYLIDGYLCHRATAQEIIEHFKTKTK